MILSSGLGGTMLLNVNKPRDGNQLQKEEGGRISKWVPPSRTS